MIKLSKNHRKKSIKSVKLSKSLHSFSYVHLELLFFMSMINQDEILFSNQYLQGCCQDLSP